MFTQVAESPSPFVQSRERDWNAQKSRRYTTTSGSALAAGQHEASHSEVTVIGPPLVIRQTSGWILGKGFLTTHVAERHPAVYSGVWFLPGSIAGSRSHSPTDLQPQEFSGKERTYEVSSWVLVIRDLIERDRILDARETLARVPAHAFASEELQRLRTVIAPPTAKRIEYRGVSRRAEFEFLKAHGHEHRGKWVAVLGGQIVASANSLPALREELARLQVSGRPLIHRIP